MNSSFCLQGAAAAKLGARGGVPNDVLAAALLFSTSRAAGLPVYMGDFANRVDVPLRAFGAVHRRLAAELGIKGAAPDPVALARRAIAAALTAFPGARLVRCSRGIGTQTTGQPFNLLNITVSSFGHSQHTAIHRSPALHMGPIYSLSIGIDMVVWGPATCTQKSTLTE